MTGLEVDTSFGEVYFFGPKSILVLLKYGLNKSAPKYGTFAPFLNMFDFEPP